LQYVSEDACDIGRCHPLGLFDHGRGAVKGVDMFRSLGQFHGESPGATADIKYPITWTLSRPGFVGGYDALASGIIIV